MIPISHYPARIVFYTYFVACKKNKLAQKQAGTAAYDTRSKEQ